MQPKTKHTSDLRTLTHFKSDVSLLSAESLVTCQLPVEMLVQIISMRKKPTQRTLTIDWIIWLESCLFWRPHFVSYPAFVAYTLKWEFPATAAGIHLHEPNSVKETSSFSFFRRAVSTEIYVFQRQASVMYLLASHATGKTLCITLSHQRRRMSCPTNTELQQLTKCATSIV